MASDRRPALRARGAGARRPRVPTCFAGCAWPRLGDLAGAIDAHEAALARNPSLAQAHANLISLYGRTGQWAKAEAALQGGARPRLQRRRGALQLRRAARPAATVARGGGRLSCWQSRPIRSTRRRATTSGRLLEGERKLAEATDAVSAGGGGRTRVCGWPATISAECCWPRGSSTRPSPSSSSCASRRTPSHRATVYAPGRRTRAGRAAGRQGVALAREARQLAERFGQQRAGRRPSTATWRASNESRLAVLATASLAAGRSRPAEPGRSTAIFEEVAAQRGPDVRPQRRRERASSTWPEVMGAGAALIDYDNDGDLDVYLLQNQSLDQGRPRASWPHASPVSQRARRDAGSWRSPTSPPAAASAARQLRHGRRHGRLRQRRRHRSLRHRARPQHAVPQQRRRHVHRRHRGRRRRRPALEHGGDVRRLRPRRRPRPVRRQLPRLLGDGQQAVLRSRRHARLLRAAFVPAGARSAVPQRRRRPLHRRHRGRRHHEGRWRRARRRDRRLQRRRLARPLRRQRRDAEPAVDQPEETARSSTKGRWPGVALNAAGNPEGSMGVASGDYDRDGDEDLVRHQHHRRDLCALHQRRPRRVRRHARGRGLAQPTAAFTGFGTDWIDYDNDGWLDLFVANGAVNIVEA